MGFICFYMQYYHYLPGGGEIYQVFGGRISSFEEGNIMATEKNITWEKGSNIIFPLILRFMNIKWGRKS